MHRPSCRLASTNRSAGVRPPPRRVAGHGGRARPRPSGGATAPRCARSGPFAEQGQPGVDPPQPQGGQHRDQVRLPLRGGETPGADQVRRMSRRARGGGFGEAPRREGDQRRHVQARRRPSVEPGRRGRGGGPAVGQHPVHPSRRQPIARVRKRCAPGGCCARTRPPAAGAAWAAASVRAGWRGAGDSTSTSGRRAFSRRRSRSAAPDKGERSGT